MVGIVLYKLHSSLLTFEFILLLTGILLLLLFLLFFVRKWLEYKHRWLFGFISTIVFLLLGYSLSFFHNTSNAFIEPPTEKITWIGQVVESPSKTAKSVKTVVELKEIEDGKFPDLTSQKILVYIAQDSNAFNFGIGDILVAESYLKKIDGAHNPAQFDYSRFMANRSIYLQTFVQDWEKIGSGQNIYKLADNLRAHFLEIFRKAGLEGSNFAVASALTLGYDNELDYQMRNAFSGSGAMHILSVSGLHVGIIYLIISFLSSFMKKSRKLRFLRCILILCTLWFYALITGLSPPVQRSAFMFSFIVIAEYFGRNNNIFNSLAASILVLILINPNIIFDVGFQLSYSAVIGIVLIHPKIYPLFEFDSKPLDYIWNLIAISLAAQLATLPFALFYFHQFPNLFLLTNIIVVPLSFWILTAAMLLLLVYSIFSTTFLIGFILKILVIALNKTVLLFYQIPYSVTDGIYISLFNTILILTAIIFFIAYLHYYKAKYFLVSIAFLSIISIGQLLEYQMQKDQSLLTVYHIRDHTAFSSIKGKEAVVLADFEEIDRSASTITDHFASLGISNYSWVNMDSVANFNDGKIFYQKARLASYIIIHEKEFLIPSNEAESHRNIDDLHFENLLISENHYHLPCFPTSRIIFNPSIPQYQRKWMLKDAKNCNSAIISSYDYLSWKD